MSDAETEATDATAGEQTTDQQPDNSGKPVGDDIGSESETQSPDEADAQAGDDGQSDEQADT